jgi:hypothetical protein
MSLTIAITPNLGNFTQLLTFLIPILGFSQSAKAWIDTLSALVRGSLLGSLFLLSVSLSVEQVTLITQWYEKKSGRFP